MSWLPQRAVVDQVDAILIDHADDPLFIRAPTQPDAERFGQLAEAAAELAPGVDFIIDRATGTVSWLPAGPHRAASLLKAQSIDGFGNALTRNDIEEALRARHWYRRGTDYRLSRGKIVIDDALALRMTASGRHRDRALQAIEAREGALISPEETTLARMTVGDLFRLYGVLAGLSGEAGLAADQLARLQHLTTVVLNDGRAASHRADEPDLLYEKSEDRTAAIIRDAAARHRNGQPVVVATSSAAAGQVVAGLLKKSGVHRAVVVSGGGRQVAQSFAAAGDRGAATVLAGPVPHGHDIPVALGEDAGAGSEPCRGLAVLVAGRGSSRRTDNWLRNLAGRRGERGETQFYLSAEDPLLAGLQSRVLSWIPAAVRQRADGAPVDGVMARLIDQVQHDDEAAGFESLLVRLEFVNPESVQRREIYEVRERIVLSSDLSGYLRALMRQVAESFVRRYADPGRLARALAGLRPAELSTANLADSLARANPSDLAGIVEADLIAAYGARTASVGAATLGGMEHRVALSVLDMSWRQQLADLEAMRLVCAATPNPADSLPEFRAVAASKYRALREQIAADTLGYLFYSEPPG